MSVTTVLLVFLEGFLAFISPCILPMLPVYFLYLSGESLREKNPATSGNGNIPVKSAPQKKRLVINTLFFILGFTLVFLLLGATATYIGQALSGNRMIWERVAGGVIILLGIHMTGLVRIPFLNQEHRMNWQRKGSSIFSSFILGVAFSFGWSPCLGPFLGSALMLSGQSETLIQGMTLLFVFSMGLAIPFILASILFEELSSLFAWFNKHIRLIKIVSGSLLILLGLIMLLGWFGYYSRLFT